MCIKIKEKYSKIYTIENNRENEATKITGKAKQETT